MFDGFTDEQLQDLIAVGDEVRFARRRCALPRRRTRRLLVGAARRAGRSHPRASAARKWSSNVMDRPGMWAGGFRAWDDAARYLTTGQGVVAGRVSGCRRPRSATARVRGSPSAFTSSRASSRPCATWKRVSREREALDRARHARRRSRPRDQQPGVGGDPRGRRAAAHLRHAVVVAPPSRRAIVAGRRSSWPSTRCAEVDVRHRRPRSARARRSRRRALRAGSRHTGSATAGDIAPALAAAGVDVAWCERGRRCSTADTLEPGLEWVASTLATAALLSEVKEATRRISELVAAVKSYSQLDRASMQRIDVTEGIDSTLVMLGHKLRGGVARRARLRRRRSRGSRRTPAELNQVWTNLIDNAIDAMDGRGTLRVCTRADGDDRRRDRRHRHRDVRRGAGPRVRSVLHDQGRRPGHGPRPRHLAPHRRGASQRRHRHRRSAGTDRAAGSSAAPSRRPLLTRGRFTRTGGVARSPCRLCFARHNHRRRRDGTLAVVSPDLSGARIGNRARTGGERLPLVCRGGERRLLRSDDSSAGRRRHHQRHRLPLAE